MFTSSLSPTNGSSIPSLVIRSLNLLGLKEYLSNYKKGEVTSPSRPTINVTNLNPVCFDKTNERTLLVLMHFLLGLIDPSFPGKCSAFWPYQDSSEKNEFKRITQETLNNLVARNILDLADCRASILTVAKGYNVWILLWKLSNAAIDGFLISESVPLIANLTLNTESESSTTEVDSNANYLASVKELSDKEILLMNEELEITRDRVKSKEEYVRALEDRLKEAIKRIEKHKLSLKKICSGPNGKFLTSQSKLDRSEMIMRIKSTRELLHTVLENLKVDDHENDAATTRKKDDLVYKYIESNKSSNVINNLKAQLQSLSTRISLSSGRDIDEDLAESGELFSNEELEIISQQCLITAEQSNRLLQALQAAAGGGGAQLIVSES